MRYRSPWRRALRLVAMALLVGALTGTLALAVQVRRVKVLGAEHFAARDVETVLGSAMGERLIAASAEGLRERAMTVPWVADAAVKLTFDGTMTCTVTEREPVALARDGGRQQLVDATGRLMGAAGSASGLTVLDGFGPFLEERGDILTALPALERAWGGRVERVERISAGDVALHFADTPFVVLAPTHRAEVLTTARAVAAAWTASRRAAPQRVDARVAGRVALLPAAPPPPTESGENG
jgi:cell division septal protein FtsQ